MSPFIISDCVLLPVIFNESFVKSAKFITDVRNPFSKIPFYTYLQPSSLTDGSSETINVTL